MTKPGAWAYCTLLTNDAYLIAALVLAQSLRNSGTAITLCALIIPTAVSEESKKRLEDLYDQVIAVPAVLGISAANLQIIGRPDLHTTLTKLNLWSLSQYDRVLYLDADTLVLSNLDHLFSLPNHIDLAASPELGFPDCFNSGVMLLKPDVATFADLSKLAREMESFDGGDQGLLNVYFGDGTYGHPLRQLLATEKHAGHTTRMWHRLSFTYNMEMHKVYRLYIPAVLRYRPEYKVLHFIGKDKPWHFPNGKVERPDDMPVYFQFYCEMVERWWEVYRQVDTLDSRSGSEIPALPIF